MHVIYLGSPDPRLFFVYILISNEHDAIPNVITSGPPEDLTPWRELPAWLLVKLPELRKLQIWLDHSNRTNWTVVNERAILKPIAALKSNVPELEVVCLLPKLNPRIQSSERHYIRWMPGFVSDEVKEHEMKEDEVKDEGKDEAKEDKVGGPPPNFELHRVLRQRMRVRTFNMGQQAIKTDWDFPFTFGLYEIGGDDGGRSGTGRGEDVEAWTGNFSARGGKVCDSGGLYWGVLTLHPGGKKKFAFELVLLLKRCILSHFISYK